MNLKSSLLTPSAALHAAVVELSVSPNRSVIRKYIDWLRQPLADKPSAVLATHPHNKDNVDNFIFMRIQALPLLLNSLQISNMSSSYSLERRRVNPRDRRSISTPCTITQLLRIDPKQDEPAVGIWMKNWSTPHYSYPRTFMDTCR